MRERKRERESGVKRWPSTGENAGGATDGGEERRSPDR